MGRLDGKRALVTGGSSGIGFATARKFIDEGAEVIVAASSQASAQAAADRLGVGASGVGANALAILEQRALAGTVSQRFGKIDVAFLNAGIADFRPFDQHDERSYDQLFGVNVKGLFFLVQALSPVLADGASVIVTSSNVADGGHALANVYAATKAATSSLVHSWNTELLRTRGIRFNAVSPGPTDTPLFEKPGSPFSDRQAAQAALASQIPAGRLANPREIADLVVFLASDESSYIVDQDILVDGGLHVLD